MIRPGALGAYAQLPFRLIDDATGIAQPSYVFLAADVKALIAGAWVNVGLQVVELGGAGLGNGGYAVELTALQTVAAAAAGANIHYYLNVAGFTESDQFRYELIEAAPPTAAEIAAAFLASSHIAGRTVKGVLSRLDQLVTGKHTGMVGAMWELFAPDGVTEWVRALQDVGLGTRETATIVLGE